MRLKTTLIKEEGGRAYYEATTPGFSVFAIVLEKDGAKVAAPVSTPAPVATVVYAPIGLVVAGLLALALRRRE
ncbi:MAG: hypothetical protein WBJ06_04665 [Candidatus Methanoculleus thermohydrogenotrophicum]